MATKLQKLDADYKLQAEQCESISNENQVKAAELKVTYEYIALSCNVLSKFPICSMLQVYDIACPLRAATRGGAGRH